MEKSGEMFNFSSNLWYNKRCISEAGESSIYLQVVIDRKHKEFQLKLRWPVKNIDLVKGVLLPRQKSDSEVVDYNLIIQSERAKHTEIHRTYRIRNEPLDINQFAKEVLVFDQRECFTSYMERERNRRYRKKEIERKTWENAHAVKMQVLAYDPVSLFRNMDTKWIKGFKSFLIKKPYAPGTVWERIKTVKTYLTLAADEPLIFVKPDILKFPNPKPVTKTTFLNMEELRRLLIINRTGGLKDIEERVLKAFLYTCFTSLRISDIYRANSQWQVDGDWLQFIPHKNFKKQKWLKIPIMPIARQFIGVSLGKYFDLPTEQEYNRTLKDLAVIAEISKNLTSHVGRHTFGYLYMTSIGNIYGLQEILGHSKIETTLRYAHLDEEYKMDSVKKIQSGFSDFMVRKIG